MATKTCRAVLYTRRTGRYLDRAQYDTPSSIRRCQCDDCMRLRALHRAKLLGISIDNTLLKRNWEEEK